MVTHKVKFPSDHDEGTILHSDQGYNLNTSLIISKGIRPSMLCKGNSLDKGMVKSFFGILKSEMFYSFENSYQSLDELEREITDYIYTTITNALEQN